MNGYLTKFEFFMTDTHIEKLGISNHIIYKSISGPLHVYGSCLHNVFDTGNKIFSYIVEEKDCPLIDAIKKVGEYGSEVTFYHDTKWSEEIHTLTSNNIGVGDNTIEILKTNNLFLIGIYSNVNNTFLNYQQLFENILVIIILGIILFKFGNFIKEKIKTYRKKIKSTNFEGVEGEMCTICLEEFIQQENVIILKCTHVFHEECINEWLEKKPSCPNCNQNVYNENETTPLI